MAFTHEVFVFVQSVMWLSPPECSLLHIPEIVVVHRVGFKETLNSQIRYTVRSGHLDMCV